MSNPEKRDERSMSDILASIRKIMAQEPAGDASLGPTPSLNGVSGSALDLPKGPELKLPPERKPSEGFASPASPAAEPVSLDELLAETPRVTPAAAQALAPKPPVQAGPAMKPVDAPEWLFPKPQASETGQEKPAAPVLPIPTPAKGVDASPPASPASGAHQPSPAAKIGPSEQSKSTNEPTTAAPPIGPPAPKPGDLGSVVPGQRDSGGSGPVIAAGPSPSANAERPVLGPPLAGPLLGEPTRMPSGLEPLQEVPGADALRRLIAGVIPPSSHPSVTPAVKAPVSGTSGAEGAPKTDAGPKPAPEIETETKAAAPVATPPAAKKPDVVAPTPLSAPAPKPIAAAPAQVSTPAPAPKPATPAPAAKSEPQAQAPAAKPAELAAGSPVGKTMDETVVELLRPLLREWLNSNMPRLIEPALKAEIEALRDAVAKDKGD